METIASAAVSQGKSRTERADCRGYCDGYNRHLMSERFVGGLTRNS